MPCKYQISECKCSNIPLERTAKKVDVFFITEFPGKTETKEKKYLSGPINKYFREMLRVLKEQTGFTYAISAVTRSTSKPGILVHSSPEVRACVHNLKAEIEKCEPKVIITLGSLAYSVIDKLHALPKHGDRVEDGRMIKKDVFGTKYPVMFCQHPSWYFKNESNAIGTLYRNIFKAIEYAKYKINPNIPNITTTETLHKLSEVKELLDDMRQAEEFVTVDTEGCNLNRVYGNKLLSVQLCNDGKVGYLIPYQHKDSPFLGKIDKLRSLLIDFFFDKPTKVIAYPFVNTKYDYHQFFREMHRFSLNAPLMDVSFAEYSLDENLVRIKSFPQQKGPFSLFTMSYKRGYKFYSKTDAKEKRAILDKIPLKEWEEYAGADVIAPWHILKKQIQEAERTGYREGFLFLNTIYCNHLMRTLTYAEHCGLGVNRKRIKEFVESDSVIQSALRDITNRFYELPTVQEANKRLAREKTGIATGLAGNVRVWTPSSPKHRELLYFDVMELDPVNEEDDGDNSHTGKNFQKNYEGVPEVDLLTEWMSFSKMMSGFVDPMNAFLDKHNPEGSIDMYTDDRARTSFYPLAVTGRLRSSSPNLQQRPAGRSKAAKEILSLYEPRKGKVVVKLDYATFEVKGTGFLSGDKVMIKSFCEMHDLKEQFRASPRCFVEDGYKLQKDALKDTKKDLLKRKQELADSKGIVSKKDYKLAKKKYREDVKAYKDSITKLDEEKKKDPVGMSKSYVTLLSDSHRKFASLFFKTPVTKITKVQRQSAKSLVFGLIYGMSLPSIAKVLKITEEEAQALHDKYMKSFPQASKWLAKSKQFARKKLWVQSPLGRRRRLWGHLRCDKGVSSKMDRYAGNTVVQGNCSDNNIIGASLCIYGIEKHNKLKYQVSDSECWDYTNIIHDSDEFEIPLEDTYYFIKTFEKCFTEYLQYYLEKVFGFKIEIPLEVDLTVGVNYGVTRDWNGSDEDLVDCVKWLCEEVAKRDKTDVMDYKKIVKSPLFKKYPPEFMMGVIQERIKKDLRTIKKLNMHIGQGGTK